MYFKIIGGSIPKVKFPLISEDKVRVKLVPASIRIVLILVEEIIIIWIL